MRTHYTPARISHLVIWLAAALIALLLTSAWRLDGPEASPATTQDIAAAARFERAAQALCGDIHVVAHAGAGVVQCIRSSNGVQS